MTPEPAWVDLGLPSGLLWAKYNLGANSPEESGLYFSWGNTEGHVRGSGYNFSLENYATTPGAAITTSLPEENDAAHVMLGAPWRMPTRTELQELVDNCTFEWYTLKGVVGSKITSNVNGKTIFVPAAGNYNGLSLNNVGVHGYCFTKTPAADSLAYRLNANESGEDLITEGTRAFGFNIRPVYQPSV